MGLTNDLISQFVKTTMDKTEVKKETTVYGTVIFNDDATYVKIDGSDILTPVESTVTVKNGERVSVMISNHKAVITGNHTDPSASSEELELASIENNNNDSNIMKALTCSIDLIVNSKIGSDEWTIGEVLESYDEADENVDESLKKRFLTLQGAIDAIPKFFNNKTIHISIETDIIDDTYIRGIAGGALRIYMNGNAMYGWVRGYTCSATINLYGGSKENVYDAIGIIHPNVGMSISSRAASFGWEACQYVSMYNIIVFAPDSLPSDISNTDRVAISSRAGTGCVYCDNVKIVNADIGFRATNGSQIHVYESSGVASKYGFQSTSGGVISISNNKQAGGMVANINKHDGGQIWHDENGPTFEVGEKTQSGIPALTTSKKLISIKSSYGDAYRLTKYIGWKRDGKVRQGNYGFGNCVGYWFFGTEFSELKGKDITKISITIERLVGGSSGAVKLNIKTHNYTSRPNGAPELGMLCGTLALSVGSKGTLTITNETILESIKNGKVKGFGIQTSNSSSNYAVCSGSVSVKITLGGGND